MDAPISMMNSSMKEGDNGIQCDRHACVLSPAYVGIQVMLALLGVASNIMMLLVIAWNRTLHNSKSVFSVILIGCDLCVCLTLLPLILATNQITPSVACNVAGGFYVYFRWGSLLAVALKSGERCISVRAPLRYPKLVTGRRISAVISASALVVLLLALLPAFGVGVYAYCPGRGLCSPSFRRSLAHAIVLLIVADCVPFLFTIAAYVAMVNVALRAAKRGKIVCDENNCSYVSDRKAEVKPIQTLIAMTGVYIVCWVPYIVVNLYAAASGGAPANYTDSITECLVICTSLLNPWMYAMFDRTFRSAIYSSMTKVRARLAKPRERMSTESKLGITVIDQDRKITQQDQDQLNKTPMTPEIMNLSDIDTKQITETTEHIGPAEHTNPTEHIDTTEHTNPTEHTEQSVPVLTVLQATQDVT